MVTPEIYQHIYQLVLDIMRGSPEVKHILGKDLVDLPEDLISVNSLSVKTADTTVYKLHLPTAEAQAAFEWRAEVMIDNKEQGLLKHYLLKDEPEIVEAYGTKLFEVKDPGELKGYLEQLKSELAPTFVPELESKFIA